jgi:hypothetical protein
MWLMKLLASRRSSTANIDVTDPDSYCNGSVAETGVFFGIIIKEKQMKNFDKFYKPAMWSTTVLLATILAACGGGGGGVAPGSAGSGTVGATCSGSACVNLGTAANYAILAKTGVATVPNSVVTGNVGLSPAAGSFLTGWSETANGAPVTYSTSAQVAAPGKLYASNYTGGTTSVDLTTAVGNMETAYTNANGMSPAGGGLTTACPGTGALSGLTLTPGVYTCTSALSIATTAVTLSGAGVYVIRTTGAFTTTGTGVKVTLSGGALAQNVFWVVGGDTTISASAQIAGVILDKTAINMGNLSSINGRLLSQTAVNLNATTVTQP